MRESNESIGESHSGKELLVLSEESSILVSMDLRTKLVFALVAVALSTMVALGAFMFFFANRQLRETRLQQLEGLARSMDDRLGVPSQARRQPDPVARSLGSG